MNVPFESVIAYIWNALSRKTQRAYPGDLIVGRIHRIDGRRLGEAAIWKAHRPKHIAVLGKTGTGKTSLLHLFAEQDIRSGHGFAFFDLHGQTTAPLLQALLKHERHRQGDIAARVVLIDPAERQGSVGINVLAVSDAHESFVRVAEIVEVLRSRWHLDSFGARTEELLRNALLILVGAGLTLLELEPLLTDPVFRSHWVGRAADGPARRYFEYRFESLSAPMRAVVIEPVLNKITAFTADPHIRHIVGQSPATLDFRSILENQQIVIVNLDKGRLGVHALTLGSLILTQIKVALFGRESRQVFTLYCDEIQHLVAYDQGLESLLAEARKFGVSIVSANQYLDQLTPAMRAALLSAGTQAFFQLNGSDAQRIASLSGEPQVTADRLRQLPQRHLLLRRPSGRMHEVETPLLGKRWIDTTGLRRRIAARWTRARTEIEQQIVLRQRIQRKELDGWD